ncbi:MAG: hypothetical protein EBT24_12200, partial [Betaproteobacteria bacterium]|nr:hypothetical protein [Betaproteobacteria bacterium]
MSAAALLCALALIAASPVDAASHSAGAAPTTPAGAAPTSAAPPTPSGSCHQQASEKKLAGAAKSSFLTKCEREATERCEAAAAEKKLAGAARTG